VGWEADAILGKSDEFIKTKFPTTADRQDRAEILCGLLNTARQQADSFKTPPVKSKRSSAKQDSFKEKLKRRNALYDRQANCNVCNDQTPRVLEGAHVVAHAHKALLESQFAKDPDNLPISVNDASNGILLCPTCHSCYDLPLGKKSKKRFIHIDPNGTIILNGETKDINYKNLHGQRVPWVPGTANYPTLQLLKFALTLSSAKDRRIEELKEELEENEEEDEHALPTNTLFQSSSSKDSRVGGKRKRRQAAGKEVKCVQKKQKTQDDELALYGLAENERGELKTIQFHLQKSRRVFPCQRRPGARVEPSSCVCARNFISGGYCRSCKVYYY